MRHVTRASGGDDQAVVGELLAGGEQHLVRAEVDALGTGVEPGVDALVFVPGLRQQVQAVHRGAAVDQARDAHPVVERKLLPADDRDLARRV